MGGSLSIIAAITARLAEVWHRLVPADLFRPGVPLSAPHRLTVPGLPLAPAQIAALAATVPARGDVALVLPLDALLKQTITLPAGAMGEADAAIALRLRQTMPRQGAGLIWRKRREARDRDSVTYGVHIAKAAEIGALAQGFAAAGCRVRSVAAEAGDLAPFLLPGHKPTVARVWQGATVAALILALVWPLWSIRSATRKVEEANSALATEVEDLKARALEARAAADAGARDGAAVAESLGLFNLHRARVALLAALTDALPDTVWVSELTIQDRTLYMAAFATSDVTAVLDLLQGLAPVRAVRLDGPIIPDSLSGESRFQVVIELREEGA